MPEKNQDLEEVPEDVSSTAADEAGLPDEVIDRALTLTRRARAAVDENERNAYLDERDKLLADSGFEARVREDDTGETLVLYPTEWIAEGTIQMDQISDTGRGIERSVSGPGSDDDWETVDEHNREVATRIRQQHGQVHGETATAFADFLSNHYAKPLEAATPSEREEFRTEYFPRNAWPSEEQLDRLDESLRLVVEMANSS